jgi:hypothetical protein
MKGKQKSNYISGFEILQHTAIRLGISGFEEGPKSILTEMRERDSAIIKMREEVKKEYAE